MIVAEQDVATALSFANRVYELDNGQVGVQRHARQSQRQPRSHAELPRRRNVIPWDEVPEQPDSLDFDWHRKAADQERHLVEMVAVMRLHGLGEPGDAFVVTDIGQGVDVGRKRAVGVRGWHRSPRSIRSLFNVAKGILAVQYDEMATGPGR